ncbi:MAG: hypothetical protein ACO25K_07590, partial [Candidatus Fonsibacter ubiquis]
MMQFKIIRVSASADNTDEQFFKWDFFVHASSLEDCYSKLEQFDKDHIDSIECENDLYIVKKFPQVS